MKKLIIAFFCIAMVNCLFAQNQQPFQYNKQSIQNLLKKSSSRQFVASDSMLAQPEIVDTARYLATVKKGKIFTLPQDKMPCLKPDSLYAGHLPIKSFHYNNGLIIKQKGKLPAAMELERLRPAMQQMPNAYRGNAIVFEKLN